MKKEYCIYIIIFLLLINIGISITNIIKNKKENYQACDLCTSNADCASSTIGKTCTNQTGTGAPGCCY